MCETKHSFLSLSFSLYAFFSSPLSSFPAAAVSLLSAGERRPADSSAIRLSSPPSTQSLDFPIKPWKSPNSAKSDHLGKTWESVRFRRLRRWPRFRRPVSSGVRRCYSWLVNVVGGYGNLRWGMGGIGMSRCSLNSTRGFLSPSGQPCYLRRYADEVMGD